jgi:phage recombination protein Bet
MEEFKMNDVINVNENLIKELEQKRQVIKNTVAKDANNDEFEMFMHLAKTYGLDPFQKEIYFWKDKTGTPTIMTSRDGYLKIANSHPAYEGKVSDIICENDIFEKTGKNDVKHNYGLKSRGKIVGAYSVIYRSDRKIPEFIFVNFDEYNKPNSTVWRNYPSAMILKVAEAMGLKRAFSVSGLVSREEIDSEPMLPEPKDITPIINNNQTKQEKFVDINTEKPKELTEREQTMKDIIGESDVLRGELRSYLSFIKEQRGMTKQQKLSINDLSEKEFFEMEDMLSKIKILEESKEIDDDNIFSETTQRALDKIK